MPAPGAWASLGLGFGCGLAAAAAACLWLGRRAAPRAGAPSTSTASWHALCASLRAALAAPPERWVLGGCRVPAVELAALHGLELDADGFARCDLHVSRGTIVAVAPATAGETARVRMGGRVVLPRFADAHTHVHKAHLIGRCANPSGTMNDALRREPLEAARWAAESPSPAASLSLRYEFSLRAAYAHGSRALRTHLDGVQHEAALPGLRAAIYAAFAAARARWLPRGLELQGVANLFLPHYAGAMGGSEAAAAAHVALAAGTEGVVLGAYCPRPDPSDPACDVAAVQGWLAALFAHAKAQPRDPRGPGCPGFAADLCRELDVDLHIDEHNSGPFAHLALPALCGALEAARADGYNGRVLLGHCTALSLGLEGASAADDEQRIALIGRLGALGGRVSVVLNPTTNLALQDRQGTAPPIGQAVPPASDGPRTPRWRGLTAVQELARAGVRVCAASDNVRDWWYQVQGARPASRARAPPALTRPPPLPALSRSTATTTSSRPARSPCASATWTRRPRRPRAPPRRRRRRPRRARSRAARRGSA